MKLMLLFGTVVFVLVAGVCALVWFFVRPLLAERGVVALTAYDYEVRGWKAERAGRWAEALRAYDQAIALFPQDPQAYACREALLAAHPELAKPVA